jgi:hypothetical protein
MIVGESRAVPPCACLACGKIVNAATSVGEADHWPEPGAITICIGCGHLMAFDDNLCLRELTSQEMYDIAGDRRVLAIQRARETWSKS